MRPFRRRALLASLAVVLLAGGLADPLGAETRPKKEKPPASKPVRPPAATGEARSPLPAPYVEMNAEKMPFGSMAWWEQMRREGRLGGETP